MRCKAGCSTKGGAGKRGGAKSEVECRAGRGWVEKGAWRRSMRRARVQASEVGAVRGGAAPKRGAWRQAEHVEGGENAWMGAQRRGGHQEAKGP